MKIRFWGTRGSLAKPGPDTLRYGGNTSCVQLVADSGTQLVIDCGTGAHALGMHLLSDPTQSPSGALLLSHTHWDHIQGIPFFAPLFVPQQVWDVYAPRGLARSLDETLAGQMQYTYFPIKLADLGAQIRFHELVEGQFNIEDVFVSARYLNHPCITLGYRFEVDNAVLVYACDHEPMGQQPESGFPDIQKAESQYVEFLRGADLVIHDAQYRGREYASKRGWGHSTIEYAVAVCRAAGVRRLVLTHHDPLRTDTDIDQDLRALATLREAQASDELEVVAAAEGDVFELRDTQPTSSAGTQTQPDALSEVRAEVRTAVVLAPSCTPAAKMVGAAAEAEGLEVMHADTPDALRCLRDAEDAMLVVVAQDEASAGYDGMLSTARALQDSNRAAVIVVGEHADQITDDPGIESLVWPFSEQYARARLSASAMRSALRWLRAQVPDNETDRLDSLRQLGILDTAPEERFDLLATVASQALSVPIALVSLVDEDRQWFKACIGLEVRETSRDFAFCAHAILTKEMLIVPDALNDDRFADNPLVRGEPRVRFYAGVPLSLPDGALVGTLCIIDMRPRHLAASEQSLLANIARLVELELARS